jgi:hypothetical protein
MKSDAARFLPGFCPSGCDRLMRAPFINPDLENHGGQTKIGKKHGPEEDFLH